MPNPLLGPFRRRRAPVPGSGSPHAAGVPGEVLALRRSGEPLRVLVRVRREPCPHCGTGVRTVSLWSTLKGRVEMIAWCGHCFNATCQRVRPTPEEWDQLHQACVALRQARPVRHFRCARHAVEHLERVR